jgi:hypothetical protein
MVYEYCTSAQLYISYIRVVFEALIIRQTNYLQTYLHTSKGIQNYLNFQESNQNCLNFPESNPLHSQLHSQKKRDCLQRLSILCFRSSDWWIKVVVVSIEGVFD